MSGLTEAEVAALLDAVEERMDILFPAVNGNYDKYEEVSNYMKFEAWEEIAAIVNAINGKNMSGEEIEMWHIKVMTCI